MRKHVAGLIWYRWQIPREESDEQNRRGAIVRSIGTARVTATAAILRRAWGKK